MDQNKVYSSSPLNANETNDDLHTQYINFSNYKEPVVNFKINDWFKRNTWKYAEDIVTKGVKTNYIIGGEHSDKMMQNISLVENETDNESSFNTDNQNDS